MTELLSYLMLLVPIILQSHSLHRLIKNRWFDTPSGDSSVHFFFIGEFERIRKGLEPTLLIKNASKPNSPSMGYTLANLFPRDLLLRHSWVHFACLYLIGCIIVFGVQFYCVNQLNLNDFDSFFLFLSFALYLTFFPDHLSVDEFRIQYKILNQRYLNNILVSVCPLLLVFYEYYHSTILLVFATLVFSISQRISKFAFQSVFVFSIFGAILFNNILINIYTFSCIINVIISGKHYIAEVCSLARSLFFQVQRLSSISGFLSFNFINRFEGFFKKNKLYLYFFYTIWLFIPNNRELRRFILSEYSILYIPSLILLFSEVDLNKFSLYIVHINCIVCLISLLFTLNILSFAGEGFRYLGSLGYYTGAAQFVIFMSYIFNSSQFSNFETLMFLIFIITIVLSTKKYFMFFSPPNKEYLFKNIASSLKHPFQKGVIAGSPMTAPFPFINEFGGTLKFFFPNALTQSFIKNYTNGYPKLKFTDKLISDYGISLLLQDKDFNDFEFDNFLSATSFELQILHECSKYKLIRFNNSSND